MADQIDISTTNGNQAGEASLAAPRPESPPPGGSEQGDFFNHLSEIRAELEDLQQILNNIRRGKTVIPTYVDYVRTTKRNLAELMDKINCSDEKPKRVVNLTIIIRHLNNYWEQIQASPLIADPQCEPPTSVQLHYLDLLDEQIHGFIYNIAELTIPHQINQWTKSSKPGYFIDFHEVFVRDLPLQEDRDRLLKIIGRTPHMTPGGFVDIDNGRIYCYSTNPWRRLLSVGMLLLALVIATGIVAGSTLINQNGAIASWPLSPANLTQMLVAWAAVLVGMAVHVVVGSAKRSKTKNGMPSVLMDLILIIDARFGEILMKLILGLIGLFGLVILSSSRLPWLNFFTSILEQTTAVGGETAQKALLAQVTPLNAFLVGYSLDSIIELFGTSMEGASQVKSMK
jgi:hypothetical protein